MPSVHECGFSRLTDGRSHTRAISRWAEAHYGLISRAKLLQIGLSPDQIDWLIDQGWLIPALSGVFYVGHRSGVAGQREALALAGCGPGAALSGISAAAWQRMTEPYDGPVHVAVRPGKTKPLPGVVRHRYRPGDVTTVRGLACVTPERAVMDLPRDRLRQALQWLMKAGTDLEPVVERVHGRRGAKQFRAEVALLVPQMAHTMSELEDRFLRLCRRHGIPLPEVNVASGGDLLDCTWPGHPLVVELDGRRWHEHRWQQDRERDRRRVLEGRIPVRFGWRDVVGDGPRTASEIRALLER